MADSALPSWSDVARAGEAWAAPRRPRPGDVPLILYRDANSWCPFCQRVWFFMELKGLRYATERIHLQGDPAEPPKQEFYKRLVPSGAVPALRIRDEVVPESLDILYRLEEEFPDPVMVPEGSGDYVWRLAECSMMFNTDDSAWLHNKKASREEALRADVLGRLSWLEERLAAQGGPFFLGEAVSLAEAAFVGFLTRCAHNFLFFKELDIRNSLCYPRIAAWFQAMERLPAYQATKQDAYFEQRIFQSHPERRAGAEACMHLGHTGACIGEPDCRRQPAPPSASLVCGSMPALEAASRLADRRGLVARFLLRKHGVAAATDTMLTTTELHIQAVAAVLAGLVNPAAAVQAVGGASVFAAGPVRRLGMLTGTPRDMSSAAAAQLRAAIDAMAAAPAAGWDIVD
eukprot:NODE_9956_length_1387_cov_6.820635.p1 GENE.NODE_9956_length_1387_cov_6.820635~~NODE_9956_length_1387_cov_6.820635.p1  ORF type:complete len:402 (-),score=129.88 NODE_9956_length_1387_cov_6.820635:127-1332(-)